MSARFADPDKTGYFVEDGAIRRFTTYSGVRYVHPQPIVAELLPATTGSCQVKVKRLLRIASIVCEH